MLDSHSKGEEIKSEPDNLAQNERLSLISQYVPISLETTAENEPESVVAVDESNEEPFPESFLHDDQFDIASWPGQEGLNMGERPVLEAEKPAISASARMIAKNGLVKALDRLKHIKENTAGAYYMANVRLAEARDKIINAFTSPEYKGNRRVVMAIGGLAVAAAGAYLAYKGFAPSGNSASHTHETVANASHHHAAVKETAPAAQHHPKNAGTITKHTRHVAVSLKQASRSVAVKAGDGYTQVIEKLFPGHAPADYLAADKAAIAHQGPGIIHGIGHYKMANGEWGLSGKGKAEVSAKTLRFLRGFFKANQ